MKKIILLTTLSFLFITSVLGIGPACRHRHNGFLGIWFRNVYMSASSGLNPELCLSCTNPGNKLCRERNATNTTHAPVGYDDVDLENMEKMWDYIDSQVESRNYEGNHEIHVQVQGETFMRVYKGTWRLGEKGAGEDLFERFDIPN